MTAMSNLHYLSRSPHLASLLQMHKLGCQPKNNAFVWCDWCYETHYLGQSQQWILWLQVPVVRGQTLSPLFLHNYFSAHQPMHLDPVVLMANISTELSLLLRAPVAVSLLTQEQASAQPDLRQARPLVAYLRRHYAPKATDKAGDGSPSMQA